MVEAEEVGVRCSSSECKHIQFLPFECLKCGRKFCIEHVGSGKHKCSETEQPKKLGSLDGVFGKKGGEKELPAINCSMERCSRVGIMCRKCEKILCSEHIYETEHNCVGSSRAKAGGVLGLRKRYPEGEILKGSTLPEESKLSKMLRKIMIKSKSIGDSTIPVRNRVAVALYVSNYVECLKYINKELPLCIWLNGEKTVGWNLDYISEKLRVLKRGGGGCSRQSQVKGTPNFVGLVLFKNKDIYGKDIPEKKALEMDAELRRHVSDGESLLLDFGYV